MYYLRPDENVLYGGAVTTSAGTTDTTHQDDWLVDGRGRPARATNGTVTWAVTALASGLIEIIVVHSHTIDAERDIDIGGGVTATLVGPTARTNGIPVNPFGLCTPATTDNVTVGVVSNSKAVAIGELLGGKLRQTTHGVPINSDIQLVEFKVASPSRFGSVPDVDLGMAARRIRFTLVCADYDELDEILDWWEASRNEVRPSVIVPFPDKNDAWVVKFLDRPRWTAPEGVPHVQLAFEEWPRHRWIA
jgi:hypothetical protein